MPAKSCKKPRRKTHRIGAHSRDAAITSIDGRTREGRFARAVRQALIEHVGGNPTAPQMLLIQFAAVKAVRLALLSNKMLTDDSTTVDHHFIAWANGLRRDLEALGLTTPERAVPSLQAVLGGKGGQ